MNPNPTIPAGIMTTASQSPFPAAKYIKEIGRGVNGARALPREDAQALFGAILAGRVSDIEMGAVLMAYRIKGEAPHELAGMLDAAHEHCAPLAAPADKPVVVIPSYNGARKQPNLVPLLAMLLARDGLPTLVHGTRHFPGRVTSMSLFEALGVPLCATTEAASVAGPFVTLILGFVSGVFIPVSMLPAWMLDVGKLFPLEHLARGLQQAFGVPGSTGISAIDLAVILAWGAAGIAAALAGFRWQPHDSW